MNYCQLILFKWSHARELHVTDDRELSRSCDSHVDTVQWRLVSLWFPLHVDRHGDNAININVESSIAARTKKISVSWNRPVWIVLSEPGRDQESVRSYGKVTWPWRQEKAGFPTLARSKRGDIHRRSFGMLRCLTASFFPFFSSFLSSFERSIPCDFIHASLPTRCTFSKSHFSRLNETAASHT